MKQNYALDSVSFPNFSNFRSITSSRTYYSILSGESPISILHENVPPSFQKYRHFPIQILVFRTEVISFGENVHFYFCHWLMVVLSMDYNSIMIWCLLNMICCIGIEVKVIEISIRKEKVCWHNLQLQHTNSTRAKKHSLNNVQLVHVQLIDSSN